MLRCTPTALMTKCELPLDVVISGGGLVGTAVMAALQQLRIRAPSSSAGLSKLLMVEAGKRPEYNHDNIMHRIRTVSLTPVSSKILENLGVWSKLTTKHSYYRIAVRHEKTNSPAMGTGSFQSFFSIGSSGYATSAEPLIEFTDLQKPVGFMCCNSELNAAMLGVVENGAQPTDKICFQSKLQNISLPPASVIDGPLGVSDVMKDDGAVEHLSFKLLLGCEGRNSPLRDTLSVPSLQHDYAQTAFVCDVRLHKDDDGNVCCFQNFFNDGKIIAMLPTSADSANIVFSTTSSDARRLMGISQEDLVAELNNRLHAFAPRDIPKIMEVPEWSTDGKRHRAQGSFPLRLNFTTTPYGSRAVLLGDAAHGIHPFAGQGLNMGIYDVCALAHVLDTALRSGQDIGNSVAVGQTFAGEMAAHTAPIIAGMEIIKHFLYNAPSLSCAGMRAMNRIPFLSTISKDAILQVASGAVFARRHSECFLLA